MKPFTSQKIAPSVEILAKTISTDSLPPALVLRPDIGLITAQPVTGRYLHRSITGLYDVAGTVTPKGDYLVMFPDGGHYNMQSEKVNDLLAYRSSDRGATWVGPTIPSVVDFSEHGFIPLISRFHPRRLYNFGTVARPPEFDAHHPADHENAPLGFRWSDDDGANWTEPQIIRPVNDPTFKAMSRTRMCETASGVWLMGAHEGDWSEKPLRTRQYILRSTDRGATWTSVPGPRPNGWQCPGFGRMDELRCLHLGNDEVLALARTPEGHLWSLRSMDAGATWAGPQPTSLVHPDAPPMVYLLSDQKTLVVLHHNRASAASLPMAERAHLSMEHPCMRDRAQLWVSLSHDGGRSWDAPRFLLVNALLPFDRDVFHNYQCSYTDLFIDGGYLHILVPHRWRRVLYLRMAESDLTMLPTAAELGV